MIIQVSHLKNAISFIGLWYHKIVYMLSGYLIINFIRLYNLSNNHLVETCLIDVLGTDPLDMEALLTSPSGKSETCEIRDMDDWLCAIKFKPKEEGIHTISLKFKGLHFAG